MRLETARAICPTMHCALPPPCQAKNPASEPSVAFGERLDQQEDPPAADRRWRRSVRLGLAPQRRFLLQRQRMMDGMAESPFNLVLAGRLQAILLGGLATDGAPRIRLRSRRRHRISRPAQLPG